MRLPFWGIVPKEGDPFSLQRPITFMFGEDILALSFADSAGFSVGED